MPFCFLIQPVGQRGSCRFVHQAQHFESGNAPGILRSLALRIVEIRGHRDDSLGDGRVEKALGVALELTQNERGNLRRSEGLVAEFDAKHFALLEVIGKTEREELQFLCDVFDAAAHQALDGIDCAI